MNPYEDMLGLERPVSPKHPPMPRAERAKQFMPFASLRGFGDVITDRETIRVPRRMLSEDERETMDGCLARIAAALARGGHPEVRLLLFTKDLSRSDDNAEWGGYRDIIGLVEKFRPVERELKVNGIWYPLDRIDGILEDGK